MKTKWTLTVLSFVILVVAACSNDTANQNSTTAPTTQPQVQPPVVVSPTSPQVTKPQIQPPITSTPSPGQTPQPVPATEAKTAEILVNDLNVRSSPNIDSQVRGTLPKGTQAKIIQQQGNWYYIVMGRVEGWVSGSYVKVLDGNPGNAGSEPKPITGDKTAAILVNDLNVRSSPDTNSQIRGTLPKGTQAKIIQQQGNWYYIVMGRVEGWVSGSYIKVLDGNPGNVKR